MNEIAIIPNPKHIARLPGTHALSSETRIFTAPEFHPVAIVVQKALSAATGWDFDLCEAPAATEAIRDPFLRSAICLAISDDLEPEGYRLGIGWNSVRITASRSAGAFYAVQTLFQLLPPAVHQGVPRIDVSWSLPCLNIEDSPRFSWRGAMLDSARYFQPVTFIKKFLDGLALHKLNIFHWHLVDDQGWRLEVKKYPQLTEYGSARTETIRGHLIAGLGGDGEPYGGFYTQDEVREIVAYAAARFITVVPEIEMPGHAQAAVAAYPQLGCTSNPVEVSTKWGVHKTLYQPSEQVFTFLEDVLEEVLELFPSEFIHIGGDEAEKDQWENSLEIQHRMKDLGVSDAHALQSYFISRIGRFLTNKGRRLIGWDEILEGGLPSAATVMSWRGPAGGITAANAGHDVVMAPQEHTYLDFYQDLDTSSEPLTIHGHLSLEMVHGFEPVPPNISEDRQHHILGTQGQLWTEYMPTTTHIEYMAFPRLCALAEVAWSPKDRPDFPEFSSRMSTHLKRLSLLGYRFRPMS